MDRYRHKTGEMKTGDSRGEVEQRRQCLTTDDTENITQKEHNYKPRKKKIEWTVSGVSHKIGGMTHGRIIIKGWKQNTKFS